MLCRPRHQTFSSWGSFKGAPTTVILQYRPGSESQWFLILLTCSFSTFFYRMVLKHRVHATTLICISQWGNKHKSLSPACKATDTWAHHAIFPSSRCTSIFPFGKQNILNEFGPTCKLRSCWENIYAHRPPQGRLILCILCPTGKLTRNI